MSQPETSPRPFRALYYPYSRCLREVDLKRAILVFDELLFVDPLSGDITGHPGQMAVETQLELRSALDHRQSSSSQHVLDRWYPPDQSYAAWYDVAEIYERLSKHGITRLVSPQAHLEPAEQVLKYAVLRDLSQVRYQSYRYGRFKWKLHLSRVPNGLLELQHEEEVLRAVVERSSGKDIVGDDVGRRLEHLTEILASISQAVDQGKGEELTLPVGIAHSLVLNQALLLCEELQAFPITDDKFAHAGLVRKIEHVHSLSSALPERGLVPTPAAADLYRVQFFTFGVISRLIPDAALARLDIDDIVAYRKENDDALNRFREHMTEVASTISSEPWKANFQSEILRAIEAKILPEVRVVDDQLRTSYEKIFGSAITKFGSALTKVIAPAIPTMTLATFLGLSMGQIVWLGAAAAVSGVGMVLPELMTYRQEGRKIKRNGLAFLLEFGDVWDLRRR